MWASTMTSLHPQSHVTQAAARKASEAAEEVARLTRLVAEKDAAIKSQTEKAERVQVHSCQLWLLSVVSNIRHPAGKQ